MKPPSRYTSGTETASRHAWTPSFIGLLWVPLAILVASNGYAEEPRSKPSRKLFPVSRNGKWGYIGKTGNLVIPLQFEKAQEFSNGLARVRPEGKLGDVYIDTTGAIAIDLYPQLPDAFYQRLKKGGAFIRYDKELDRHVYFDEGTQEWVAIDPKFPIWAYGDFSDGLAHVWLRKDEKCGYIDTTGNLVIRIPCEHAENFSEGMALIQMGRLVQVGDLLQGAKFGYIDNTGNMVVSAQFDQAGDFSEGLAPVETNGKWGYLDKMGKFVIEPQFDSASEFSEGLACVTHAGEDGYGYIDKTGQFVIQPRFDWAANFSEGLAGVVLDYKIGYIDPKGNFVIKPQFETAGGPFDEEGQTGGFSEGLAPMEIDGQVGYIDRTGKVVIAPQFDRAYSFSGGLARVEAGDKTGYIDRTGKYVWESSN